MKKMAALFTESMREFRNIRTITACGLFAALALILRLVHRSDRELLKDRRIRSSE